MDTETRWVASSADDIRDARPATYDWHFGDIPLAVRKTIATATVWAIVLDIDETWLSNGEQIVHNSFAYVPSGNCDLKAQSACGQRAWELSAQATAIKPTLELFNLAQKLKGKSGEPVAVFFITGRHDDPFERPATEWNLRKGRLRQWRTLFMWPESSPQDKLVSRYKTLSRIKVEATHTIIANVGDQLSDLSGDQNGDYAKRCFKVPNPF